MLVNFITFSSQNLTSFKSKFLSGNFVSSRPVNADLTKRHKLKTNVIMIASEIKASSVYLNFGTYFGAILMLARGANTLPAPILVTPKTGVRRAVTSDWKLN
jgi:hypothetical protein